ncbi:MAG TPA: threonine aldolase family protein [Pseudonocardiaceae bacterium]|nr:threonine aldolase family protein [Pseudonocardiaceae bacterium]
MDTARIDLRSDTVAGPSAAMRKAMAEAEVGDDLFDDDPTVNRLQDRVAELTGKEAALYLPTGTMCNEIAMHVYARSGHFVVCEQNAHVGGHEVTSAALLSGIAFRYLPSVGRGMITPEQVAEALEPDPYGVNVVDLVTLENTHQIGGGTPIPVDEVRAIAAVCRQYRVPLYLDGARIFNACTVTGTKLAEYSAEVDALMFCLSKGLGAPVGSVLAGDADFVAEAKRMKILMGAGWRQAGILAAAGLVALEHGPCRLHEDHANARRLAEGVGTILPGSVDLDEVATNIVFVDVSGTGHPAPEWAAALAANGLLVTMVGGRVRMLTHVDITPADIDRVLTIWRETAAQLA